MGRCSRRVNAYNSTLVKKSCNATRCLCTFKQKRNYQRENGLWKIVMCYRCGLYGTHRVCSFLESYRRWCCKTCNGGAGVEEERLLSQNRRLAVHHMSALTATIPDASKGILERRTCTIQNCLCPYKRTRKHQEEIGSWEILICGICGIYGTHRICSFVKCFQTWYCTACKAIRSRNHQTI
ncbi:PHD finger protein 7-like [Acyrthosiphon pisum]|uniref:PHF7/G2E3-like PHD zinc finger domain-containing protein n=1 Tax=Acyrthosiphon pisum TaxID=7029 RepID=A0A8R2AAE5_ACYPI|nr:PHD finger protein 7-like [Acyrthosiphon pisum]|eukprot:XP_003242518.2 PREDICTED: PHD finger protein 7-like [Acyrthosiphon pisum]